MTIPKHGTIQYHPSLLPKYRGPSSINWPIIKGDTETGLTIFRPSDGLDEGAVILRKKTPIAPDDTLGTVYFDRLFPMGVQALLEAADLVLSGRHSETVQDESQASYEGWCRAAEAKIDWAKPIDHIYNLVRGCNPAPGAWTLNGKKLQIFDARKTVFRRFAEVPGKIGEVTDVTPQSFKVTGQGGSIEVLKAKFEDGKKISGGELAQAGGIQSGTDARELGVLLRCAPTAQNIADRFIALVARILVDPVAVVPSQRHRDLPRLRIFFRIVHRDFVKDGIGVGARKALDEMQRCALRNTFDAPTGRTRRDPAFAVEVGGIDHERFALPMAA